MSPFIFVAGGPFSGAQFEVQRDHLLPSPGDAVLGVDKDPLSLSGKKKVRRHKLELIPARRGVARAFSRDSLCYGVRARMEYINAKC